MVECGQAGVGNAPVEGRHFATAKPLIFGMLVGRAKGNPFATTLAVEAHRALEF